MRRSRNHNNCGDRSVDSSTGNRKTAMHVATVLSSNTRATKFDRGQVVERILNLCTHAMTHQSCLTARYEQDIRAFQSALVEDLILNLVHIAIRTDARSCGRISIKWPK